VIFEPKLETAVLEKRYKRFLADVVHPDLGHITVHCPNTGSMKNCWQAGWNIWLQKSDNPKRKYPYTWILAQNSQHEFIGINTLFANKLVLDALNQNIICEVSDIENIASEVKYGGEKSRIDFLITHSDNKKTYIEVKSVTLKGEGSQGYFPDAVTARGQKHLRELIHCKQQGHNAILFFMVQHSGIDSVQVEKSIDPEYFELLKQAVKLGVQVVAYKAKINPQEIVVDHAVPFIL
jgi:sugar fermentation stimulation protein A